MARSECLVLVVDEDAATADILRIALAADRCLTVRCPSARQAWAWMHRTRPGLVLCEVDLPDVSGPNLVRRMKRNPALADLPVILVSDRREPRAHVADYFLRKPLDPVETMEAIEANLIAAALVG
jgi:DNA-binding response OmpR family regulator